MVRVGVGNVDISGYYHAPTPRYWKKISRKYTYPHIVAIYSLTFKGSTTDIDINFGQLY